MDLDTHPFDRVFKNYSRLRVKLLLHQMIWEMNNVDFDAMVEQTARGLEAKQATSDNCRPAAVGSVLSDLLAVVECAKDEYSLPQISIRFLQARNRWN